MLAAQRCSRVWPWPAMLPTLAGEAGRRLLAEHPDRDDVHPERFARFATLAELIAEARHDTPTMIVLDDAHYADESALVLTRFLADTLESSNRRTSRSCFAAAAEPGGPSPARACGSSFPTSSA